MSVGPSPKLAPNRRRVLFVDSLWVEKFGIMSLSASLKQAGWSTSLALTRNARKLLNAIAEYKPDILAFSVTTGDFPLVVRLAERVSKRFPHLPIIVGGPHVTYYPETINMGPFVAGFRGECDTVVAQGLAAVLHRSVSPRLCNVVVPYEGGVFLGDLVDLVQDLDTLPMPDRELYLRIPFFASSPYKSFVVTRGCPHSCAFCFNKRLRSLYKKKGRFVRMRSPESILEEARWVKSRYGMKLASFEDDILTADKRWLERLVTKWKQHINVPYNLNATAPDLCDKKLVALLKETGVWCVAFGIETGSEFLRTQVLNKKVTNEQIEQAAAYLQEAGILFHTYNMFGLPHESVSDSLETVRLNRRIGTKLARYTLFHPYPGTDLGEDWDIERFMSDSGCRFLYDSSRLLTSAGGARTLLLQKLAVYAMRSCHVEQFALNFPVPGSFAARSVSKAIFWASYFNVVRKYMQTGWAHLLKVGVKSMIDLV